MKHIIAVYGQTHYDLDKEEHVYSITRIVPEDIIDWLEMHDKIISAKGETIYVCNKIKYVYIGPHLEIPEMEIKTEC